MAVIIHVKLKENRRTGAKEFGLSLNAITTSGSAKALARAINVIWKRIGHAASEMTGFGSRDKLEVTIGCTKSSSTEVAASGKWNQNKVR